MAERSWPGGHSCGGQVLELDAPRIRPTYSVGTTQNDRLAWTNARSVGAGDKAKARWRRSDHLGFARNALEPFPLRLV